MRKMLFEDTLFPLSEKLKVAKANVSLDAITVLENGGNLAERFAQLAPKFYPEFSEVAGRACIGVLSLMLPVGCNAICPNICYTDITHWKKDERHLTIEQILMILDEFKELGGRLVRVVGDGEPVIYRELPTLCQKVRDLGMNLLLFSNGVVIPESVLQEYEKGNLYFYIKLWSENVDLQNRLVSPRTPYEYVDGDVGLAPLPFYELRKIDPKRVGFQVLASTLNEEDAWRILDGSKSNLPMFVDPFVPQGAGAENRDLSVDGFPVNKDCSFPPRASYLAVVNSRGELQAGTFVPENAVSVRGGKLREVWSRIFATNPFFFQARYTQGCFCELMRGLARKKS